MELLLIIGGVISLIVGIYSIFRVRKEYQHAGLLSNFTVTVVWFEYIFVTLLVIASSIYAPWQIFELTGITTLVGILLILAGIVTFSIGIAQFGSFRRMSGQDTNQLITSGIYKKSRNPQNFGWYIGLVGIAILGMSPLALGFTLAFILLLHIYITGIEEPFLRKMYGKKFKTYMKDTSRYWAFGKSNK